MNSIRKRLNSVSEGYLSLWRRLTGWRLFLFYVVHYTLLFALLRRIVFAPFINEGKSFVWSTDGIAQHYTRLVYIRHLWREGIRNLLAGKGWQFPLYDFSGNAVRMDTQLGLPQFLAILWPFESFDVFYDLYALGNYYWMGLTFSVFGFYWKQKPLPVLTGAVSYVFSGIVLFTGVRHPHFAVAMVLMPVLLISIEEVLHGRRAAVFTATVFLLLTTQHGLYFSCMQAILALLYVAVRLWDVYLAKEPRQALCQVGRLAMWGIIAALLAAPSWLPALMSIMGIDRVGNTSFNENMARYARDYYIRFFGLFAVNPGEVKYWTYLGLSALTLPAVVLLFVRRRRKERSLKLLFLALSVMLFVPGVGYVMSGFSNVSNRWCYAYAFCAAAILMFMAQQMSTLSRKELILTGAGIAAYCAAAVAIGIRTGVYNLRGIVIMAVVTALLGLCFVFGVREKRLMLVTFVITCASVCYTAYWLYDAHEINYVSPFYVDPSKNIAAGQYASLAESDVVKADTGFYRVSGNDTLSTEVNAAFQFDVNGLSSYSYYGWSSAYLRWLGEMEACRLSSRQFIYGKEFSTPMLALSGVKYYATRASGTGFCPSGFVEVDEVKNGDTSDIILSNEHALPIGYAYESYMTRDVYDPLPGIGKQEAQLQAVLLEETPSLHGLTQAQPELTVRQIPYEIEMNGVSWKDGFLFAERNDATIKLTFDGLPKAETYLRIVDHVSVNDESWVITGRSGDVSLTGNFIADTDVYTNGQHTQTMDFGYSEEGLTEITLTFPFESLWRLADLQIWCQPMDAYAAQVAALADETLQNVATDWHSLKGDITVAGDRMLALSIPYTDGWTAYVDGAKTKLYQANTGFMAVELTEGTHKVELRYMLPGLRAGLAMGAAGVVGLAALLACGRRKKRNAAL